MRISAMLPVRPGSLGAGLVRGLLALGWWLLGGWLRRGLRSALGGSPGAGRRSFAEPPTRPRRLKNRRRGADWPAFPAAA